MNNVNSFMKDDCHYMEIPVLLKLYDQRFNVYSLQPFHLPLPNQAGKFLRVMHKPYIAVNKNAGTFVTLEEEWMKTLSCRGRHNIYCENVITEQYIAGASNCELAIVQNKSSQIKTNCRMAIVDNKAVSTAVHRIKNNSSVQ